MTVTDFASVALTTLASQAVDDVAGPTMTRGGRLLSVRGSMTVQKLTAGDGPFLCGLVDRSLTTAELLEYLNIGGPVTPNEVVPSEKAARGAQVRTLGMIVPSGDGTQASLYLDNKSLSGMKFSEEGQGWKYWILNVGPTMTTGSLFDTAAQFFVEFNPSG